MNPEIHRKWKLAEIQEVRDGPSLQLLLGDPLQRRSITLPVVVEEPTDQGPARIGWDATRKDDISHSGKDASKFDECLLSFMQLHDKSDREIVRFALGWGPLGICAHGKPYAHHPECQPLSATDRVWESDAEARTWGLGHDDVTPERWVRRRFWEPLTAWRFYSRQFSALLWVARALAKGANPSPREWFAAFPWQQAVEYGPLVAGEPYPPHKRHVEWTEANVAHLIAKDPRADWEILDSWLTTLARDAGVTPVRQRAAGDVWSHWSISFGRVPVTSPWNNEFRVNADSLFAVLVAQLSALVDNPQRIYQCSMCPSLATPKRKPKPGQRVFCSTRCRAEAQREDKKKSAAKRRAEERAERETARRSEQAPALPE